MSRFAYHRGLWSVCLAGALVGCGRERRLLSIDYHLLQERHDEALGATPQAPAAVVRPGSADEVDIASTAAHAVPPTASEDSGPGSPGRALPSVANTHRPRSTTPSRRTGCAVGPAARDSERP